MFCVSAPVCRSTRARRGQAWGQPGDLWGDLTGYPSHLLELESRFCDATKAGGFETVAQASCSSADVTRMRSCTLIRVSSSSNDMPRTLGHRSPACSVPDGPCHACSSGGAGQSPTGKSADRCQSQRLAAACRRPARAVRQCFASRLGEWCAGDSCTLGGSAGLRCSSESARLGNEPRSSGTGARQQARQAVHAWRRSA